MSHYFQHIVTTFSFHLADEGLFLIIDNLRYRSLLLVPL